MSYGVCLRSDSTQSARGVGCLDVLIDLPTPSSHVPHHRPSLWYIVWGKIGGVQLVMG